MGMAGTDFHTISLYNLVNFKVAHNMVHIQYNKLKADIILGVSDGGLVVVGSHTARNKNRHTTKKQHSNISQNFHPPVFAAWQTPRHIWCSRFMQTQCTIVSYPHYPFARASLSAKQGQPSGTESLSC